MYWDNRIVLAVHEILMALGWLVLVPAGTWMSTVGKRQYPEQWFCYHRGLMAMALVVILTAAGLAISITSPHLGSYHEILGPVLIALLLLQAIGGIIISRMGTPGGQRPFLNKLHKLAGLFLYIGALINGILGIHAYSETLICHHAIYGLAILTGAILTVHAYLFSVIIPAWCSNWCNDPQYEHLEIPLP